MTNHHSNKLATVSTSSSCGEEQIEGFDDLPTPFVFDADFNGQEVPAPFNAVRIQLDGTMQADLSWKEAKDAAEQYVQQGLMIYWDIDLGLLDRLKCHLGSQAQFLALCLSLEHFRDTLWRQFEAQTVAVCLYRGSADFSGKYQWDEEQLINLVEWIREGFGSSVDFTAETGIFLESFEVLTVELLNSVEAGRELLTLFCRDAASEYFDLLARRLPDSLKSVVMLDASSIANPLLAGQLTINERYPNLVVAVKGKCGGGWEFPWDGPSADKALITNQIPQLACRQISIGLCLPPVSSRRPSDYVGMKNVLLDLKSRKLACRIVAENRLTTEWDGLDYLIVAPKSLSQQGLRKLRGFCAAGGTVVSLGEPLGVAQEISVKEFSAKDVTRLPES